MTHLLVLVAPILIISLLRSYRSRSTAAPAPKPRPRRRAPVSFDAAAYGLVPRESLDPTRGGPPSPEHVRRQSQAVADAAWNGDWRTAATHVAAPGTDWDERWSRFELLRAIARRDDAWLTAWRAADPDNCDAAALEADLQVHRAWEIRGGGFAKEVPAENMARFRELLPAAIEAARRAALLDPENPAPWVVMVTAARGAQYKPEQFQPLWDGLVARAPHHYEGHWQGMQYWCAKWFGTNGRMMAFAEKAMDAAPAGSPLPGLYLHALSELEERKSGLPTGPAARARLAAVARALDAVRPEDDRLPGLRHLLAHHLGEAGMPAEALEQFRTIGRWCGSHVWSAQGDPVEAFHAARAEAVRNSGAQPLPPTLRTKNTDVSLHS
ncbi:hypothetical protein ACIQBJ_00665 [Kitasatospora sp. NPDC088391]|uniref:hypothetical protein n=1 Tax=Kitasatospora sp. NPDC088391 TaxID=3364074 RepID=UPI003806B4B2